MSLVLWRMFSLSHADTDVRIANKAAFSCDIFILLLLFLREPDIKLALINLPHNTRTYIGLFLSRTRQLDTGLGLSKIT